MQSTRRQFIQTTFALSAGALALAACGDETTPVTNSDAGAGPVATIGFNHGHSMQVSLADVSAAADETYDIRGSSGHTHSVTLTSADFNTLATTGSVTVTSTSGSGHTHPVTIVA